MAEMIEMMDYTEETENAFEEISTADEDADCVETESDEQENMPDAEEGRYKAMAHSILPTGMMYWC